jgi:hypothetical protein
MGSSEEQDHERRSMERRTLLRRAAVLGVAAWTAPVIVDSLASPAAALSCTGGCFRFQISVTTIDCFDVTQTETVSTISPCGTLTAASCASMSNVAPGAAVDDFAGGVCTDIPGSQIDCAREDVTFNFATTFCTWGGGGTCNTPRRLLAAQGNTSTGCVAGSINALGSSVTFLLPTGQQFQHFQFIVGCACV